MLRQLRLVYIEEVHGSLSVDVICGLRAEQSSLTLRGRSHTAWRYKGFRRLIVYTPLFNMWRRNLPQTVTALPVQDCAAEGDPASFGP